MTTTESEGGPPSAVEQTVQDATPRIEDPSRPAQQQQQQAAQEPPKKSSPSKAVANRVDENKQTIEQYMMPYALITRIIKSELPKEVNINKELKAVFSKCTTVFISYLTAASLNVAGGYNMKSINGQCVASALEELGFGDIFLDEIKHLVTSKPLPKLKPKRRAPASVPGAPYAGTLSAKRRPTLTKAPGVQEHAHAQGSSDFQSVDPPHVGIPAPPVPVFGTSAPAARTHDEQDGASQSMPLNPEIDDDDDEDAGDGGRAEEDIEMDDN